jgi:hypothetical protein
MDHETSQVILVVVLLYLGAGFLIALTRKGRVASARLGGRRLEIHTPADPQAAFERISQMRGTFKVDDQDASAKVVVLSSSISFASMGFLYPVFIHAEGSGSRIEIGCYSKFVQFGPVVGKWHRNCVQAIELVLSAPSARVA